MQKDERTKQRVGRSRSRGSLKKTEVEFYLYKKNEVEFYLYKIEVEFYLYKKIEVEFYLLVALEGRKRGLGRKGGRTRTRTREGKR